MRPSTSLRSVLARSLPRALRPSPRALLRSSLLLAALAPAACTFTIDDKTDDDDDLVCPTYKAAPCAEGTVPSTELDEQGCEVPVCITCDVIPEPECPYGERVVHHADGNGCLIPVCSGQGVPCPIYDLGECPPNSIRVWNLDEQGCEVPECVPVGCDAGPLPACGPNEHIEYLPVDYDCSQPFCVPNVSCTLKIALPPDGGSGDAPVSNCCQAMEPIACADGQTPRIDFDVFGCPTAVCPSTNDCVIGGCSGELCGEPDSELASDCAWLESYACYQQLGVCERQADGACGWTIDEPLKACLSEAGAN